MSDIDDLLAARAAQQVEPNSIDSLLAARAKGGLTSTPAAPAAPTPVTRSQSFMQGVGDVPTGLGQIAEHVAETPLNWLRAGIRGALNLSGANDAAGLFGDVSTGDFDRIVQQRENDYQKARAAAQQNGIDWWRIGGQAAATAPTVMVGGGGLAGRLAAPAASWGGRIAQASALGAAQGAAQPSSDPGSFWWDKAKGTALGAAFGAGAGAGVEGVAPALRWATNAVRSRLGVPPAGSAQAAAQAETIVNETLKAQKVDPQTINLDVLKGMRQEVADALAEGGKPNATSIVNRAKAESLPVPVRLIRGQATGDPMAYSTEQNLRGIKDVGEPITTRLQEQNSAFIQNLDALGAKNAPDPVATGQQVNDRVQSFWDDLQARKDAAYTAVRNSHGQPAAMDGFTAAQNIRDALDTPEAMHAWDTLPGHIQRTIDDLHDGKLPLTVGQMQALDKSWGADARAADGSTAYAINTARKILADAPISDDVGKGALRAYQAAKHLHAGQMSMVDPKLPNGQPNPSFQPLVKAVVIDGKPPETLFQTHFMGAAPSVASKTLQFLDRLDSAAGALPVNSSGQASIANQAAPSLRETVGRTLMGEIKRQALSSASDERGTVAQSVLNGWANEPVKSARLDAIMPPAAAQTFRDLASTVEAAKRFPVAATVNTSNTGSALVNAASSALKSGAMEKISGVTSKIPIIGPALNAKTISQGAKQSRLEAGVQSALNPGVSLNTLIGTSIKGRTARTAAERAITTGANARGDATQR